MKITRKQLNTLIEQKVRDLLFQEASVYNDPIARAFDEMLMSIERVGSMLSVDDPVYQQIESILVAAEDAHEQFVGDA